MSAIKCVGFDKADPVKQPRQVEVLHILRNLEYLDLSRLLCKNSVNCAQTNCGEIMNCWSCGANQSEDYQGKIPFKAVCEKCLAWLHCCKNCVNYSPGMSNDCKIPGTEWVANREGLNYCEEFSLKKELRPKNSSSVDDLKKSFDSLFNSD